MELMKQLKIVRKPKESNLKAKVKAKVASYLDNNNSQKLMKVLRKTTYSKHIKRIKLLKE